MANELLRGIQQLRGQTFAISWPHPLLREQFLYHERGKTNIFWPPTAYPSSCPRSYWMALWTKNVFFSRKDTNVLSCVIHVTAKRILERLGVQTLYCPFFCFKKQEWMQVCRYVKVCTFWFFFFAFHQYVDITQFICDRKNPKLYFKKICLNDKH